MAAREQQDSADEKEGAASLVIKREDDDQSRSWTSSRRLLVEAQEPEYQYTSPTKALSAVNVTGKSSKQAIKHHVVAFVSAS